MKAEAAGFCRSKRAPLTWMAWPRIAINCSPRLSICTGLANRSGRIAHSKYIKREQEARFEADAWKEPISDYVATRTKVTIGEVAQFALFFDKSKIGTADQRAARSG